LSRQAVLRRRTALLLPIAVALGVVVSGCGILSDNPPTQACSTASEGTAITDPANGFALCLPPNWRDLAPGDPGWVAVYGEPDQTVEQDVAGGIIQHFAVPFEPREADEAVNLAVYVRALPAGTTVQMLGDQYEATLTKLEMGVLAREDVTIPAGPAVRITAGRHRGPVAGTYVDRLVAYTLAHGSRSYHFVFASNDQTGDDYAPVFESIARSIRFPAATP
jgi:hypothetical protein